MAQVEKRYVIHSVSRALALLKVFSAEEPELSLTEISQRLGLNCSTAFRLLTTLEAHGYLQQNADSRRYRLGIACLELGSVFLNQLDVRKRALPILRGLRDEFRETVHLATLAGPEVVFLERLDGLLSVGIMGSRVGGRTAIGSSSLGKAMLAFLPDDQRAAILDATPLRKRTQYTITDRHELEAHLQEVRRQGFAIDNVENEEGIRCVGAPIFDRHSQVVAAVSIAGPAYRLSLGQAQGLAASVKAAAAAISHELGYIA